MWKAKCVRLWLQDTQGLSHGGTCLGFDTVYLHLQDLRVSFFSSWLHLLQWGSDQVCKTILFSWILIYSVDWIPITPVSFFNTTWPCIKSSRNVNDLISVKFQTYCLRMRRGKQKKASHMFEYYCTLKPVLSWLFILLYIEIVTIGIVYLYFL